MAHTDHIRRSKRGATHDDSVTEDELSIKIPRFEELADDDEKRSHASSVSPAVGNLSFRRESRSGPDKPAELFRKDLISAMKLADTEQLQQDDYVLISDPWKQEWESGVQVPVNPETIQRNVIIRKVEGNEKLHGSYAFKFPKKYLHATLDENYKQGIHELHETQKLAEQMCRYDLDDLDVIWLSKMNDEREAMGMEPVMEWVMEKVIEEMECQCYNNMQNMIKTVEGLGIEYDENVVCDVCRSPEGEDNNEIVFCDGCDICVHQACYGIQKIPDGSWLCRTCALGIQPKCILCPKSGGAMKSTKSGTKWAHVSCALWIPEVSIGCPEKMEPVTKISQIPSSRWSLICNLCRERSGACIQCSVKTCKTAFHVTCAFNNNLTMKTMLDEDHDDVQLKAFCSKHSGKKKDGDGTPRKEPSTPRRDLILKRDPSTPTKKESEMTEEEKTELRSHRLGKLAEEFYACVEVSEVAEACKMDEETIDFIFNYWVLKRKSNFNKPLLTPKTEEADLLLKQREDSLIARMKMFIHLRQDLERVRNLCYMVSKREKIRRQLYSMKEEIFQQQVLALKKLSGPSYTREFSAVATAHREPLTLYDKYDDILRTAKISEGQSRLQDDLASEREESEPPPDILHKHKRVGKSKRRLAFHQAAKGKRSKPEPVKMDSDCESQTGSGHSGIGKTPTRSCGSGNGSRKVQFPSTPSSSEDEDVKKPGEIPRTESETFSSQESSPCPVQSGPSTGQGPVMERNQAQISDSNEKLPADKTSNSPSVDSPGTPRSPRRKRLSLRRSLRSKDTPNESDAKEDSSGKKSDESDEKPPVVDGPRRRSLRSKETSQEVPLDKNAPEESVAKPEVEKPVERAEEPLLGENTSETEVDADEKPVQLENHLRRSQRTKDVLPEDTEPCQSADEELPERAEDKPGQQENHLRRSLRVKETPLEEEEKCTLSGDKSSGTEDEQIAEESVAKNDNASKDCPAVADSPGEGVAPSTGESSALPDCPGPVQDAASPVGSIPNTDTTEPVAEVEPVDSPGSPIKCDTIKNSVEDDSEKSDCTDNMESGRSPKKTRRSGRHPKDSTPKVKNESVGKLGGNGTSLPQVEVSVDESSGKISLRVRNHSEPKLGDESVESHAESPQKIPLLEGSKRTLHRTSLESAVITASATRERKSQKIPRRSSSRLQSLGVNGLVSPDQLIVKQEVKDKVHSHLGRLRPSRFNHKHIQNGILDSSERKMDKLLASKRRSVNGSEEDDKEEVGHVFTKENNPSSASIIGKFRPIGIELSSPEISHNRKGLASPKSELASPGTCRSPVPGDPASRHSTPERRVRRKLQTSSTANLGDHLDTTEDKSTPRSNPNSLQAQRVASRTGRRFVRGSSVRSSVSSVINISDSEDSVNLVSDVDSEYAPSENSDSSGFCTRRTRRRSKVVAIDEASLDSTQSSVRSSSRLSQNFSKVLGSSGS